MSLRSFLEEMEKRGEVVHVRDEVSPLFENTNKQKNRRDHK